MVRYCDSTVALRPSDCLDRLNIVGGYYWLARVPPTFLILSRFGTDPGNLTQLICSGCVAPPRLVMYVYAIDLALQMVRPPAGVDASLDHLIGSLGFAAIAWPVIKPTWAFCGEPAVPHRPVGSDDLRARRIASKIVCRAGIFWLRSA